jgi:hypothetical protein
MGRGQRDRCRIPFLGGNVAVIRLLEAQDTQARDALLAQIVAEAIGQGAKILADHDGLVPPGFERDEPEQGLGGKVT